MITLELPGVSRITSQEEAEFKKRKRFAIILSTLLHILAITAIIVAPTILNKFGSKKPTKVTILEPIGDLSNYKIIFPTITSAKKVGGGGGGGNRSKTPASKGKLPKFSLKEQLAPPAAVIPNKNPKLPAEPTVTVPPQAEIKTPTSPDYGDPQVNNTTPSSGQGTGGGIGTGTGGGVGPGQGPGVGPGEGGGFGGGAYAVGGEVLAPVCIFCPEPQYTEEARKAKFSGVLTLLIVVDETGRVRDAEVQKPIGMGLDEQTLETIKKWRFKPAEMNGKPVPVKFVVEINFRLY